MKFVYKFTCGNYDETTEVYLTHIEDITIGRLHEMFLHALQVAFETYVEALKNDPEYMKDFTVKYWTVHYETVEQMEKLYGFEHLKVNHEINLWSQLPQTRQIPNVFETQVIELLTRLGEKAKEELKAL